jgi:hypothetical protein
MCPDPYGFRIDHAGVMRFRRRHGAVSEDHDGRVVEPGAGTEPVNDAPPVTAADVGARDRAHTSARRLTYATARYRDRVLDGPQVWGSINTGPDRQGCRRYRLVLFPPGVTRVERRLLRLWQALPTWGAVLWLMSVIYLSQSHTPWAALGIATTVYLAVGAVTFDRLGMLRTQVRTLSVVIIAGHSDSDSAAIHAELMKLGTILCTADALLGQGRISSADHEFIWWQVYDLAGQQRDTLDLGSP